MDIKEMTPMVAMIAISIFLVKGLFDLFKRRETQNESKTEKLIDALQHNTLAVTALTIRMEHLEKRLDTLPELERDVARLGQKVRDMDK